MSFLSENWIEMDNQEFVKQSTLFVIQNQHISKEDLIKCIDKIYDVETEIDIVCVKYRNNILIELFDNMINNNSFNDIDNLYKSIKRTQIPLFSSSIFMALMLNSARLYYSKKEKDGYVDYLKTIFKRIKDAIYFCYNDNNNLKNSIYIINNYSGYKNFDNYFLEFSINKENEDREKYSKDLLELYINILCYMFKIMCIYKKNNIKEAEYLSVMLTNNTWSEN